MKKMLYFKRDGGEGVGVGLQEKSQLKGWETNPIPKTFFKGGVASKGI